MASNWYVQPQHVMTIVVAIAYKLLQRQNKKKESTFGETKHFEICVKNILKCV